jgi:hypothetical protein
VIRSIQYKRRAVSLPEMCISMAASVIILGGLLLSGITLQKALHGSEVYAGSYSDQRRVIDYLGRDLRRAIAISATDADGNPFAMKGQSIEIADRATVVVTIPAYYRSDVPSSSDFTEQLPIIFSDSRAGYGGSSGAAAPIQVSYRKVFLSSAQTTCFVRQEADAEQIIVRGADTLHAKLTIDGDGHNGTVNVWFMSPYSGPKPPVSTYEELMLRNVRLDQPQ